MQKRKYELGRKSPKEIIEAMPNPEIEHVYVKAPRKELNPAYRILIDKHRAGISKEFLHDFFLHNRKGRPYMMLHTHSYEPGYGLSALLTEADLKAADEMRGQVRTFVISQRDAKTGEVQGYTFLHDKMGLQASAQSESDMRRDLKQLRRIRSDPNSTITPERYLKSISYIAKEGGFDIRFHPARDYYFDSETGNYEKKTSSSLETTVASILIGFSFMFLLAKIPFTGFLISDSIVANYGTGLFLASGTLFALIVYFILRSAIKKS